MTDIDLTFEELELEALHASEKEAGALLARLQRLRQERHVLIAIAGVENAIFRLREERRIEEAPAAYKPIGPVLSAQEQAGLIDAVVRLKPWVTFKA